MSNPLGHQTGGYTDLVLEGPNDKPQQKEPL